MPFPWAIWSRSLYRVELNLEEGPLVFFIRSTEPIRNPASNRGPKSTALNSSVNSSEEVIRQSAKNQFLLTSSTSDTVSNPGSTSQGSSLNNPAAVKPTRNAFRRRRKVQSQLTKADVFDISANDSGGTTYTCKSCKLNFTDLVTVETHLNDHAEKRPFVCEHCPRKYKSAAKLKTHARIHGNDIYKFECDTCGYGSSSKWDLDKHKRKHNTELCVHCEECGKEYRSVIGLEAHMNRVHREAAPYKCDECGQSFFSKQDFLFHMRQNHPQDEDCACDVCGEHFSSLRQWRRHRESHEKQTAYLCDLCGKSVTTQTSLVDHRRIHTGERPFMCPHCGKTFVKRTSLQYHIRTHTGERPYECEICGKRFTQRSPYKIHMRIHTGERPYKCDICHEGFISRSALNSHLEGHMRTGKARPNMRRAKNKTAAVMSDTDPDIMFADFSTESEMITIDGNASTNDE